MGHEHVVTSEVTSDSLGHPPSVSSWICVGQNSRVATVKRKMGYSWRRCTPYTDCGPSQKAGEAQEVKLEF